MLNKRFDLKLTPDHVQV